MISKRDSRFELLRTVAILLIILHHLMLHVAIDDYSGISINRLVSQYYLLGGKLGVNCFLLITGYFGLKAKFKVSKALRVEVQVVTYTVFFLLFTVLVNPSVIGMKSVLMSVAPTTFGAYWYITAYMALYLLSPFLNRVIESSSQKNYRYLLIILLFMESIAPTVLRQRHWANDVIWFSTMYLLGAYINKYQDSFFAFVKHKQWLVLTIALSVLTWGLSAGLLVLSQVKASFERYVNVFALSNYSTFILLMSVTLFMYFATMDGFYNKRINGLAANTLGVYLIQSNPFVATYFLWPTLKNLEFHTLWLWPLLALVISFGVYIICTLIEYVRRTIAKKMTFMNCVYDKLDAFISLDD